VKDMGCPDLAIDESHAYRADFVGWDIKNASVDDLWGYLGLLYDALENICIPSIYWYQQGDYGITWISSATPTIDFVRFRMEYIVTVLKYFEVWEHIDGSEFRVCDDFLDSLAERYYDSKADEEDYDGYDEDDDEEDEDDEDDWSWMPYDPNMNNNQEVPSMATNLVIGRDGKLSLAGQVQPRAEVVSTNLTPDINGVIPGDAIKSSIIINKEGENTMNINTRNLFDGIGVDKSGLFKISMMGLAIRNNEGRYVVYDGTQMIDVMDMVIDAQDMIFRLPATEVKVGDLIISHREPLFVKAVNADRTLTVLNPLSDKVETVAPSKSILGFGFYTKVVSMIDKLAKTGVIHKNKASNLKSKLTKRVNALA
jgi:hypothetical protein